MRKKHNGGGSVDIPSKLLEMVYPVGSIYMSANDVSPAMFLGGTWISLKNRFLVGAGDSYTVDSTGGDTTHTHSTNGHTLVESEIPSHTHGEAGTHTHTRGTMDITGSVTSVEFNPQKTIEGSGALSVSDQQSSWTNFKTGSQTIISGRDVTFTASNSWTGESSENGAHTHNSVGGGSPHSHGDTNSSSSLPPYLAVYMWKRVA